MSIQLLQLSDSWDAMGSSWGGAKEVRKQICQKGSVCTGMRATAALAFLLTEEFSEGKKSVESCIAYLFLGISEKNETSHQPSHDWH